MSEPMNVPNDLNIPEDLREGYDDCMRTRMDDEHIDWVCGLIERIGKLEDQNAELNDNLRQMTECRDDLTRLIAQRDSENAALRKQVADRAPRVDTALETIAGTYEYALKLTGESRPRARKPKGTA